MKLPFRNPYTKNNEFKHFRVPSFAVDVDGGKFIYAIPFAGTLSGRVKRLLEGKGYKECWNLMLGQFFRKSVQ